ncbi:MAG: CpaE family protein [Eubacterium sp.]
MEKLNLVVLSEETQLKVNIKNKIVDESIAVVGYADYKEESRLKIEGLFPDVVICAVREPIRPEIFSFIEEMHFQKAGCSVIIVTDKVTVSLVNRAARSGIRQVLDLSMSPDEFCGCIQQVAEFERKVRAELNIEKRVRSKVIGFFGCKGGTGKSTVAANVAVALAKKGARVMLLDFDLSFGDLQLLLDLDPKETIVELVQDPEGISIEKINSFAVQHSSGVSLLGAPKSPEFAEYVTADYIKKIIENVRPYYEYIIIDAGSTFTDPAIAALDGCDEIMLVNNPEICCLKEAKATVLILEQLQQKEKVRIIINKNAQSLVKAKEFENMLDMSVYGTISFDYTTVTKATNKGQPYVMYSSHATVTKDTMALVERIMADKVD